MKRHYLLIPCALIPYFAIFTMIFFVRSIMIPFVICGIIFLLLLLTSLPLSIIYAVRCVKEKAPAREIAKANMIVKLIHIPAYLAIFFIGCICFVTIFTFWFVVPLTLFDLYLIIQTGVIGALASKQSCSEGKISSCWWVLCAISQFIYCVDVVAAIVLFVKQKSKTTESSAVA